MLDIYILYILIYKTIVKPSDIYTVMNMKHVVARQYRDNMNAVRERFAGIQAPPDGWLRSMRTALGMSGAQLARRMGITRDAISKFDKAELEGAISIKSMQNLAASMNAKFVYAIVPEEDIEDIIARRANEKAEKIVREPSVHMALEAQTISEQRLKEQIKLLARELCEDTPSKLWNDE
jgi:predicted DNA-binding mobile mystery protein A